MRTARAISLAFLTALSACTTLPTTLRVDTDPAGADVDSPQIGYLGTTPLVWQFTESDLDKIAATGNVRLSLNITKRGYVSVRSLPISFEKGTSHTIKKILEERLSEVAITSDPEGVAVYQLLFASSSARASFDKAPAGKARVDWIEKNPTIVTKRFLGATPTSYQYDPENVLEHNEPLLFTKTGYEDEIVYFKVTQERLHQIMQK